MFSNLYVGSVTIFICLALPFLLEGRGMSGSFILLLM